MAAPFAAAIAILVVGALITNDPPARLGNGQLNSLHVSLSLYPDLGGVLIVLSILMLATAMWRKRLLLGIVTALYGLGIFNLHYWGFGVPFIMLSAWLLARGLQGAARPAGGDGPGGKRRGPAPGSRRPIAEDASEPQSALHAAGSGSQEARNAKIRERPACRVTTVEDFLSRDAVRSGRHRPDQDAPQPLSAC